MSKDRHRGGPTVLRILLGAQLRRLREAADHTRTSAGYTIRASESKMSRIERGDVSFKDRDVRDLLLLYGVADADELDQLAALAKQANKPGWWQSYSDVFPHWFDAYVGLEEAADRIRTYEVQFVPGLLQIEDYARAVATMGQPGASSEEIERKVNLRLKRQKLLNEPDAPHLWAVVDEAALRRPIGGREVMRAQLEHLRAMTKSANVTLQVMPFNRGGHPAEGGPFIILRFAHEELPDIVYLEQLTGALYVEKREELDRYSDVMDRLSVQAEEPAKTADIISTILTEI